MLKRCCCAGVGKEVVSRFSTNLSSNAYDVCSRMRTYADVCCCAGVGKEVVSRLSTNLSSNAYFLTDSNGRDMVRMLPYAAVCCRMLTYADVCCRMLTYAATCSPRLIN